MSAISLLTSAGLRTLLLVHRQAANTGKPLALAAVPSGVQDVMEVTGFLDQFTLYPTEADAVRLLG